MSDWSSNAAQRTQRQREDDQLKQAAVLQQQQLLDLNAPRLWQELRDILRQRCTEFNSEPEMRGTLADSSTNPVELRIEDTRRRANLFISFDASRHMVAFSGAFARTYGIEVLTGTRTLSFMDGTMSMPIDKIATKALDELLGI